MPLKLSLNFHNMEFANQNICTQLIKTTCNHAKKQVKEKKIYRKALTI